MTRIKLKSALRSMPLRKTAAAVYIQMHTLANEKDRLQAELIRLDTRTAEVHNRLQELELSLNQLESEAIQYKSGNIATKTGSGNFKNPKSENAILPTAQNPKYKNFVIEF